MRRHRNHGFTLIEIMITIAVLAIVATIAVPSYRDYSIRGKIPQATNNLSILRVQLEQFYQDNRTYVGACTAGTVAPVPATDDFQYSCPTLDETSFTIRATGVATGPMNGFTYTLNQNNQRTTTALPAGWGTAPISCWVTKKGGAC